MPLPVLPDVVDLTITALLAQSPVTALVGTRIHARIPGAPTWPLLVVSRVDGAENAWLAEESRVQVDCWGGGNGDVYEQSVDLIARTLIAVHRDLRGLWAPGRIFMTEVLSIVPAPDGDTGRARRIVDLLINSQS